MSSSKHLKGCTITRKVEEHCSKPRVCQSIWKVPNPAFRLVSLFGHRNPFKLLSHSISFSATLCKLISSLLSQVIQNLIFSSSCTNWQASRIPSKTLLSPTNIPSCIASNVHKIWVFQ